MPVAPSATTWAVVLFLALMSGLTTLLGVDLASRSRGLLFAVAFVSALAEPAGALIGLTLVQIAPSLNAFFMAVAAGARVFVSLHELMPMASTYGRLPLFGVGLAVSVPVYLVLRWIVPG